MPEETASTADLFEIVRTTRSMRRLKPDPVPNASAQLPCRRSGFWQRALADQHFVCGPEGVEPGRNSAVGRRMQQGSLDLIDSNAVAYDAKISPSRWIELNTCSCGSPGHWQRMMKSTPRSSRYRAISSFTDPGGDARPDCADGEIEPLPQSLFVARWRIKPRRSPARDRSGCCVDGFSITRVRVHPSS